MKKYTKIILIIIISLFSLIIIDSLQAKIFKRSPFISYKVDLDSGSYVDKSFIIDTYYCVKEQDIITVSWHFKNSKFSCPKYSSNEKQEKFLIGHTFNDNRTIHFTFDIPYKDSFISDAFLTNEIELKYFLKNLDYIDTLNDGGSTLYKYNVNKKIFGNEEFYVINCNTLSDNKDIFVARYKETIRYICSDHIDDIDGITMVQKEGTLTNIGMSIIIKDNSNRENIYGESFYIEKYDNGIWKKLESKSDMIFNSIGYTVNNDKTLELYVNWEYFYGKLDNG